ncbi:hypothetical protein D1820_02920 [Phaeobacter sp. LSS9]|nr:hypothetical protein D1820_02920 [Phaeobacter sp. LSS9]
MVFTHHQLQDGHRAGPGVQTLFRIVVQSDRRNLPDLWDLLSQQQAEPATPHAPDRPVQDQRLLRQVDLCLQTFGDI